ncbi:MAG TPA: hypothetical protein PLD47_06910 [Aggregatilineales bacterium]|nr:hypothetical protein [Anaerolineales bacterium]HRE47439.1 hypothetical protein [Aggregatilineales bacterium]
MVSKRLITYVVILIVASIGLLPAVAQEGMPPLPGELVLGDLGSPRESIVAPGRSVVVGYRNIMYPDYKAHLTEQDIEDLIVYLLTL